MLSSQENHPLDINFDSEEYNINKVDEEVSLILEEVRNNNWREAIPVQACIEKNLGNKKSNSDNVQTAKTSMSQSNVEQSKIFF